MDGGWRRRWDFDSGGALLDWGAHTLDLCQWANNSDDTMPIEYEPSDENIVCRYANGVKLVLDFLKTPFGDRSPHYLTRLGTCPVRFVGDEGWVETGDSGEIMVEPKSVNLPESTARVQGLDVTAHSRDFFDALRSRGTTRSNATVMRRSHSACHAAAISWILRRKLRLDPVSETFIGDPEANLLRSRPPVTGRFDFRACQQFADIVIAETAAQSERPGLRDKFGRGRFQHVIESDAQRRIHDLFEGFAQLGRALPGFGRNRRDPASRSFSCEHGKGLNARSKCSHLSASSIDNVPPGSRNGQRRRPTGNGQGQLPLERTNSIAGAETNKPRPMTKMASSRPSPSRSPLALPATLSDLLQGIRHLILPVVRSAAHAIVVTDAHRLEASPLIKVPKAGQPGALGPARPPRQRTVRAE
jgi:hypothetical protein